jgi:serine/threonine protein kinase
MGLVYEATHARLAGRYAVKVLLQDLTDDPSALARFDREARITSSLQHPNVVQVIDHNTTADGTSYLVMELLTGESLSHRLARTGRLPLAAVVEIIEQIAAGLAAAHGLGIVHRDLKPDNVFLVPVEGRGELVKILDFGISKSGSGIHAIDRELCGTPQYMSPEQIEGSAEIAAATDQYAMAVIAYELLTGHNPFKADGVAETFAQVATVEPPPTGLNAAVDAVLARGFAKAKARRFPTVMAFAAALRVAAEGLAPATVATATPLYPAGEMVAVPHLSRGVPRRGAGWLAGGAIVASVGVMFLFGASGEGQRFDTQGAAGLPAPVSIARDPLVPDRADAGPVAADILPGLASPPITGQTEPTRPLEQTLESASPPNASVSQRHARPERKSGRARSSIADPPTSEPAMDEDATMPLSSL